MRNRKNAVGLACQIVFEYEDWSDEHVSDMINTYAACGDQAPCTGDELADLCDLAEISKKAGKSYEETVTLLLKKGKKSYV